ncbi:MAG: sigma-70 family RNA polymerase sigma factor [bacterium]
MHPPSPDLPYHSPNAPAAPGGGDPRNATDDALLKRMSNGDEQALGVFYDRWHALVNGVVQRILRQDDDVDDVVELVFWQAWQQATRYERGRGSVQTWLLTIARSRALDKARSITRLREDPIAAADGDALVYLASDADPSISVEAGERRAQILSALADLPPEQRAPLELAYFGGLSQSEIAERTGEALGTIKTRMRLAMQKLRVRLQYLREEAR